MATTGGTDGGTRTPGTLRADLALASGRDSASAISDEDGIGLADADTDAGGACPVLAVHGRVTTEEGVSVTAAVSTATPPAATFTAGLAARRCLSAPVRPSMPAMPVTMRRARCPRVAEAWRPLRWPGALARSSARTRRSIRASKARRKSSVRARLSRNPAVSARSSRPTAVARVRRGLMSGLAGPSSRSAVAASNRSMTASRRASLSSRPVPAAGSPPASTGIIARTPPQIPCVARRHERPAEPLPFH